MNLIPRPEYPRPQMVRSEWINLNGPWEFEIDRCVSGKARGLHKVQRLSGQIIVPFCPESELSGVGERDFLNCVWYRREVTVPGDWTKAVTEAGGRVLLHFGAVDYKATVYINGQEAATHMGGYAPFSLDITPYIKAQPTVITVCAQDDVRSGKQPGGKQSPEHGSFECFYTRTTGIWQTVWLERIPKAHIDSFKIYPDPENGRVRLSVKVTGKAKLTVNASYEGRPMGSSTVTANNCQTDVIIDLQETHLWELGQGRLYDLQLFFGEDYVESYFGLRSVRMEGMKFLLNGKSVFQRLVLDQGFYPDGIYTAPTDDALKKDIELSLAAGFNGARLHEKAFEPRFLYYCDKMGYMVWGEHANWSLDISDYYALAAFLPEWTELVERDFNHPAIIGWCPFNETWDTDGRKQRDEVLALTHSMTKRLDPTRPCIDTSGNYHVVTDIFDIHDYEQDVEVFRQHYDGKIGKPDFTINVHTDDRGRPRQTYRGEPLFLSEYGGFKWEIDDGVKGWGYGVGPQTEQEFIERYRSMTLTLLENENLCGFCYTQLYDVEQEKNGLYTYRRQPKFDMSVFKAINTTPAAIEK